MPKARVIIKDEVPNIIYDGKRHLYFQKCEWQYSNGIPSEYGFRFMWRDQCGKLIPHRGQARIPSKQDIDRLLNFAVQAGWYK